MVGASAPPFTINFMEIDMNLITYHCDYSNQWFVYDDNYADDYTPHGVGYSVDEAIERYRKSKDHDTIMQHSRKLQGAKADVKRYRVEG